MDTSTYSNRTLLPIAVSILSIFSISVAFGLDDIGGVIRGPEGGEAGVWVIAETTDLKTTFRKIVVTDDDGRFLIPDLPDAKYDVWSRGYGIDDSYKESARPGDRLTINTSVAETARKAAQNYPANYWYSLLDVPKASEFPGTGDQGNGISPRVLNQAQWVDRLKDGCQLCHQKGNLATREIPEPAEFDSTRHAWDQRLQMGRGAMIGPMYQLGRKRAVDVFADWTDRIIAGEVPEPPPRPDGIQQNLVLTQWGWSNPDGFVHDNVSTDKRNPKLYPDGQIFGVAQTQGRLTITDPLKHQSRELTIPMREAGGSNTSYVGGGPSNPHNPMMDDQNRVWMTSSIRRNKNSKWCSDSDHPSVQRFPLKNSG